MQTRFALTGMCLGALFLFAITIGGRTEEIHPSALERTMDANSVRITWYFEAPLEKVWAVWTEPEAVRQWFGSDPNGKVLDADLHVRVGGRFKVRFADGDGTEHTAKGVYQLVEPHRLLKFTWSWRSEPGVETAITVSLVPVGGGTTMEFEHGGLIQASSHDYKAGWRSTFQKIEEVLARQN